MKEFLNKKFFKFIDNILIKLERFFIKNYVLKMDNLNNSFVVKKYCKEDFDIS